MGVKPSTVNVVSSSGVMQSLLGVIPVGEVLLA